MLGERALTCNLPAGLNFSNRIKGYDSRRTEMLWSQLPFRKIMTKQWSARLLECGLAAPVVFVGGGLIGSVLSEQFRRIVYSIPGGTTRVDYGLPFVSKTVLMGVSRVSTYISVSRSLEGFAKNFGFWGTVTALIAEGVLLLYLAFDSARG